jgi:hypothetical protein
MIPITSTHRTPDAIPDCDLTFASTPGRIDAFTIFSNGIDVKSDGQNGKSQQC